MWGIALASLLRERGLELMLGNICDSSAAKGIASRVGRGKIKHLQVKQLWSQDLVRTGRAIVTKVPRRIDSGDALTHGCAEAVLRDHLSRVGVEVRTEPCGSVRGGGGVGHCHSVYRS